jgi:rhamnose utilization protein RhaD (predicted bifunctional aldolase and dehydrogenase)
MHVHSIHATVLASLADSTLPPIDQNTAIFHNRVAIDENYGGLAFEAEAERCCELLSDPAKKVLVMGNHGVMVIGDDVAETFNRMYFFERAAETYIKALWTGRPLRVLPDEIAEKTAREIETYPGQADRHLAELKAILDAEGSDYASVKARTRPPGHASRLTRLGKTRNVTPSRHGVVPSSTIRLAAMLRG